MGDLDKITPHKQRAISKFFEEKDNRGASRPASTQPAKRNSRVRQNNWDDANDEDYEESDAFERFNRRPAPTPAAPNTATLPVAIVLQARGRDCVISIDGQTRTAKLASRLIMSGASSTVVVGDHVRVAVLDDDNARVDSVDPRESVLGRFVGEARSHASFDPIAANIGMVLMVCTPTSPPFRAGLIDRYFTAAALEELPFAICLNKVDLGVSDEVQMMLTGYESLGIGVYNVSAAKNEGLDTLKRALEGKITLFTGHSGVGKSTLLNTIEPGLSLTTGSVTEGTAGLGKGRHTTSSARLVPLSIPDAFVVDSPGIREFGLGAIDANDLLFGFPEIIEAAQNCRIRHCRHQAEEGCAVVAELSTTPFGQHRLASYRALGA